ncbi:C2 calcium-dependent domain-containing protein 4D [Eublepharis macularius]|uniref:C2 calcium-dependent domain-containing protein 4D n=1 Tax=Eublepharis macularius TaxID=481883 RepID=A0AA97JN59_EUBMA|nr:C2 calcium-dependent domain-containing protein 4D [Eublepharis macularius]XP_054842046.1 C2 calcium-dependent domain-containing protein 4D [Eublepharis macularius]XP_054842053.1 C2 calcium-dependent domain-containing protein 4D [Eublepharis macularius]
MFSRRKPASSLPACPNVLTPDKIPTFFIPPNLATLQGRRSQRNESQGTGEARICSPEGHIIQVESFDQDEGRTAGHLYSTISMPHLSSPEGWDLLPESPHTRRRESLFHEESLPRHSGARFTSLSRPLSYPGAALDSDTASSTETSPYGSPLLLRSLGGTLTRPAYGQRRRFTFCPTKIKAGPRPNSLSTEETSSTDTSPRIPRRETETTWRSTATLSPLPIFPLGFICCPERLTKEVMLTVSKGGQLRLLTEYLQPQRRLRVRLITAEAFYQPHCDPRHVSCCVSLRLRPGSMQRQRSAVIKRSRNPIFNEDFFFEGVLPDELPRRSLRFKVVNKGSGVRRDVLLGQCDIPLDSLVPP